MEQLFPQWRAENLTTRYPFLESASLTNGTQTILAGIILDACLYPIGGTQDMYLSSVKVDYETVTLMIGDDQNSNLASGSFSLVSPPEAVALFDSYNRPAGLLLSQPALLGAFGVWGAGTYSFTPSQTAFCATVCVPTPALGVRGIQIPDGTVFTGEVWFVGSGGVVLNSSQITIQTNNGQTQDLELIAINVVGDPLFLRQQCAEAELFTTPQFLTSITFKDQNQSVTVLPNQYGDVKITVNNNLAADTALRVHTTANGTQFDVVGATAAG